MDGATRLKRLIQHILMGYPPIGWSAGDVVDEVLAAERADERRAIREQIERDAADVPNIDPVPDWVYAILDGAATRKEEVRA
jgi:hypothetical protein